MSVASSDDPMCVFSLPLTTSTPRAVNKMLTANVELATEFLNVFGRSELEIAMKLVDHSSSGPKDMLRMLLVSDSSLFCAFLVWHVFLV